MTSLPGYDAWKLATPPEYEWPDDVCEDCRGPAHPGEPCCTACNDTRWMIGSDDLPIACTECCGDEDEVTLEDLEAHAGL
jgi:hypothetical protein